MTFIENAEKIAHVFKNQLNNYWDGQSCILEMKEAGGRHWRQMEWMGFYFEFCCQKMLQSVMEMPGPKYGKVKFDGFLDIPWDFKTHAMNTSSHKIIVNDSQAISEAIDEYGSVGLILALGKVTYNDEVRTFQKWHSELKGGKSKYEKKESSEVRGQG